MSLRRNDAAWAAPGSLSTRDPSAYHMALEEPTGAAALIPHRIGFMRSVRKAQSASAAAAPSATCMGRPCARQEGQIQAMLATRVDAGPGSLFLRAWGEHAGWKARKAGRRRAE